MADTWITDITHFMDEEGNIITEPLAAAKLGAYFAAIIVMASYIEPEFPEKYRVYCRRKPKRKLCLGEILGYMDPDTDKIVWQCPKCGDRGIISNWQGTIWDMRSADESAH